MYKLSTLKNKFNDFKKSKWSMDQILLALEWKMKCKYYFKRNKLYLHRIPFDNIGYMKTGSMLGMDKSNIQEYIKEFEEIRYLLDGWSNYKDFWQLLNLHNSGAWDVIVF
tara:strand:+ start:87 stop:416 length:330 start_codon:yes stop_codon:yes gene_type:complete